MSLEDSLKRYLKASRAEKLAKIELKEAEAELCRKLKITCGKLTFEEAQAFEGLSREVVPVAKVTHYCGNSPVVNWDYLKTLDDEHQQKLLSRTYWSALKVTGF